MSAKSRVQYVCAILLIVSSIALAFVQVCTIYNIAHGTLMYIAQAFLLAGSIFGLEYYIHKLDLFRHDYEEKTTARNQKQ